MATTSAPSIEREAVFQRGLEAYRTGLFYEAHELWEQLWDDEEDDDHRRFLQALIQAASAMHKLRNNVAPRGALKLLERAVTRTDGLPEVYGGVQLARFREALSRCREELERLLAAGVGEAEAGRAVASGFAPALDVAPDALAWRARPPEPPPDARRQLQLGVAAYRSRRYFEAHELWEIVWRDEPESVMKAFLQGLILVAAAMHKLEKMGSATGASRLFQKAAARLAGVPDGTGGMAIGLLRDDIARAIVEVDRLAVEGGTELDAALVPRMEPVGKTRPS